MVVPFAVSQAGLMKVCIKLPLFDCKQLISILPKAISLRQGNIHNIVSADLVFSRFTWDLRVALS